VGRGIAKLAALLALLVAHLRARGMQITIYDPALDPDRSCALQLVTLLELLLLCARHVARSRLVLRQLEATNQLHQPCAFDRCITKRDLGQQEFIESGSKQLGQPRSDG
jgi:hypothetical protein